MKKREDIVSLSRRDYLHTMTAALGSTVLAGFPAFGQSKFTATAGQPTPSANYAPQYVAVANKYMAEEGLDLKLLTTASGEKLREVLGAGQIKFALGDSTHPILLTNRGRPAKILLTIDDRSALCNIVMRKDLYDKGIDSIEKLAQWKRPDGSKPIVAVASLGGGQHVYLSYICERLGIADNFVWLAGGGVRTMMGGLSTSKFDAIAALPNWVIEAETQGWGKSVFDVSDTNSWKKYVGGPVPSTVAFALQTTIDREPEMVQAYVNGMYQALKWMKTASNKQVYDAIGSEYLNAFTPEVAQKELAYYRGLTNYDGVVDEQQFKNAAPIWFRDLTELKPLTYVDAVSTRFINEAIRKYGR